MAVCKLCPARSHCWDKGECQDCDFGKAYSKLERKIKRLEKKVASLREENEKLRAENEKLSGAEAFADDDGFVKVRIGSVLYAVCEDRFEGELEVFVDELVVTAVGLDRLWVGGCAPAESDAGCEILYSEIGKSVFWDREEAEADGDV